MEHDDEEKLIAAALALKLANEKSNKIKDAIPVTSQKSKWKLNRL